MTLVYPKIFLILIILITHIKVEKIGNSHFAKYHRSVIASKIMIYSFDVFSFFNHMPINTFAVSPRLKCLKYILCFNNVLKICVFQLYLHTSWTLSPFNLIKLVNSNGWHTLSCTNSSNLSWTNSS